jgi:SAM-dependent methyltransferase
LSYRYVGSELELFSAATNWKSYLASVLSRFIAGRVLEVGAGIGSNIAYLHTALVREWTSLEPDGDFARRIDERVSAGELPPTCRVIAGTIECINQAARFDTILYIDVLEHIAEDAAELARACRHLAAEGSLIVLAPAHQFLFSPFDTAIGHYRRYNQETLRALTPPGCHFDICLMLDCAGFFASLANAVLLSNAFPSKRQIAVWDRLLVPISRTLDRRIGHRLGKTIVAVWRLST